MAGQTRIDGNLIDTGTDPNDIVSVSVGDARYPRLSQDNTLAGNLTVDGQVRSDNVTDSAGTGAPAFPNGMSVTSAALTDPEITGGIYLGGTGSANYLEDYEEGTWTPGFESTSGSLGTLTFVIQVGYYTKVGNVVTIYGRTNCTTTNIGTASGELFINNLPFASADVSGGVVIAGSTAKLGGSGPQVVTADVPTNGTRFRPYKANGDTVNIADLANGSRNDFTWTVTYTV